MPYIGTKWKTVQLLLNNTDYVIVREPVVIHAFIFTYDGVGQRTAILLDNDDNTLFSLVQNNEESSIFHTSWLAGNGLKISVPAGAGHILYFSVLYSQRSN